MQNSRTEEILNSFYNLCASNRLNVNYDLFEELEKKFIQTYPEVQLFYCDNDTFSSSLIVAIPLEPSRVALLFLDQHNSEIVRMNFSYQRFLNFTAGLNKIQENLKPSSKI